MTEQELFDFWARWAHRSDISGDSPTIYAMARQRIQETALREIDDDELDLMLLESPLPLQHAGLIYVHELAQDDRQASLEAQRFFNAMGNYEMRRSREINPDPVMQPGGLVV